MTDMRLSHSNEITKQEAQRQNRNERAKLYGQELSIRVPGRPVCGVRAYYRRNSECGGTNTLYVPHQIIGSRQEDLARAHRHLLRVQGMFPRGRCSCVPGINGSPGGPRGRVVRIAPSWKHLELQSETHRHGNKGNNAAPRLTALFPIFTSITFLGLSHSNSDKSHKNCKCGSLSDCQVESVPALFSLPRLGYGVRIAYIFFIRGDWWMMRECGLVLGAWHIPESLTFVCWWEPKWITATDNDTVGTVPGAGGG